MFSTGLAGGCLSAGGGWNLTCIYIYGLTMQQLCACNNCVYHLQPLYSGNDLRCQLPDIPLFSAGGLGRPCKTFLACIIIFLHMCAEVPLPVPLPSMIMIWSRREEDMYMLSHWGLIRKSNAMNMEYNVLRKMYLKLRFSPDDAEDSDSSVSGLSWDICDTHICR